MHQGVNTFRSTCKPFWLIRSKKRFILEFGITSSIKQLIANTRHDFWNIIRETYDQVIQIIQIIIQIIQ